MTQPVKKLRTILILWVVGCEYDADAELKAVEESVDIL